MYGGCAHEPESVYRSHMDFSRREFIKASAWRSILQDGLQGNIDPFLGRVMDKHKQLGIAEALRAHLRL